VGAWPTNDGLTMTYVAWPVEEFPAFRADVEGNVLRTLDLAGDLGQRVRAGRRAERFRASPDLPSFFRRPWGPGWAPGRGRRAGDGPDHRAGHRRRPA
jgi:hypothetical protein